MLLDDDRLIERLGRALAMPDVEPTPAEIGRLHEALDPASRTGAAAPFRAETPLAQPFRTDVLVLAPAPLPARSAVEAGEAVERALAGAFDALSACLTGRDVNEVLRAAGELRAQLGAHGRMQSRDAALRARRLLGEAAQFLLSTPPADPQTARS
ncbi:MAG TPA: hypothetical protein VMU75_02260 [Acidimicrobiales bacterium]|nr:hypothetical protein [Acidimicrobiales bacterium]